MEELPLPVVNFLNVIGVPWPYLDEGLVGEFATLTRAFATAVAAALARIDAVFRAHTKTVTPELLTQRYGLPVSPGQGWWWRQMPEPEPWDNAPSRRATHN